MILETITIGSTLSTLDYHGVKEDAVTMTGSSLTTSLMSVNPRIDVYHHYRFGESYIESLSDEQLAKFDNAINEKIEKGKTLTLRKQS